MTVLTNEQQKELQSKYGFNRSIRELVEIDHKAYSFKVLPHGEDFAPACALCLADVASKVIKDERKQLLMNDLLGETVMIRAAGYKTMRKAVVQVEVSHAGTENEYHYLRFEYEGEERGQNLEKIVRLDVFVEGERLNVWDDGLADLSVWEREKMSTSARPCENKYETDMKISNS